MGKANHRISGEADLAEFIDPGEPAGQPPYHRLDMEAASGADARFTCATRAWEMSRYRAYQAQLAGHPTGEIFGRAAAFLKLAAADAPSWCSDVGARAAP